LRFMATISIKWRQPLDKLLLSLQKIRGVADLRIAQTQGFPSLDVQFDRNSIARYGLTMEDVADTVAVALGGRTAGLLFNGDRRYQIVVRVPDAERNDLEALGALPVMLPEASGAHRRSLPLRELASFEFSEGLNEISRDNGKRRIFVEANVPAAIWGRSWTRLNRPSSETCRSHLVRGLNGAANSRIFSGRSDGYSWSFRSAWS
jgi:Cu/Ag efflux pump CusA